MIDLNTVLFVIRIRAQLKSVKFVHKPRDQQFILGITHCKPPSGRFVEVHDC